MESFQNKKSEVSNFIVGIIIGTVGFLIIFVIIPIITGGADVAAADAICKGSVALKAKTYVDISPGIGDADIDIVKFGSPLYCKTSELKLPEDKNADIEIVKKEFADLMASCWNRYGEGLIEHVFKGEGVRARNNCQVCYIINLREFNYDAVSGDETVISPVEFGSYLFETPYKVKSDNDGCKISGGFCTTGDKNTCRGKFEDDGNFEIKSEPSGVCTRKGFTSCCSTDSGCRNKGGICARTNPDTDEYAAYDDIAWDCPEEYQTCFIKNENYFSYGDYIQRFGGIGRIITTAGITPGQTYAISFGSPTDNCKWCGIFTYTAIAGGVLIVGGLALAPFTGGSSLLLTAVGYTLATGVFITAVSVAGGITADKIDKTLFSERLIPTVYLTTLNQLHTQEGEELCTLIESV